MVFLEIRLVLRIRHWFSLKLHPIHYIQHLSSLSVSTVWTWLWPFFFSSGLGKLWTLSILGVSLRALLSISVQGPSQLLFPIGLFPLPLLGPRCVTHEEAQGPGPLLQSHSSFPCFVDLAPWFIQHWRHQAVLWSSGGWRAQSNILPTCQELSGLAFPPLPTGGT